MSKMICPTCRNEELEVWEIRKYKGSVPRLTDTLEIAPNPDEHSITHIYCDICDPGHGTNLVDKLNDEINVVFLD